MSVLLQHVGEDDEVSEMSSGLGASTVDSKHHEQDLAGFPEVEHSRESALSAVAEGFEEKSPQLQGSMVHSPIKLAASEHSGEAQGIGTSVHPSSQDLHSVSPALLCFSVYTCLWGCTLLRRDTVRLEHLLVFAYLRSSCQDCGDGLVLLPYGTQVRSLSLLRPDTCILRSPVMGTVQTWLVLFNKQQQQTHRLNCSTVATVSLDSPLSPGQSRVAAKWLNAQLSRLY